MAPALILLTIGLPWLGGFFVLLAGDRRPRAQHAFAIAFSVAAGLAALALLPSTTSAIVLRIPVGGIFGDLTFVPDGLGVFLAIVAAVIGSLAVIFSIDYMQDEAQLGRYYAFVLLFIGAMAGLALSGSLLFLFVFWEITALCSYTLISFHNDDPKAVAGGIKALIITQFGGLGLLAGVLIAFAHLGTYDIAHFLANAQALPPETLSAIAFGFLIAAVAKSAQVPLHTWLPDAMEAPTPVSALIHAATMVNAGVYLLARFYPAFENVPGWTSAVVAIGLLSALLAALMALVANDLKRALAYSTISQLGYMVYAVGVGAVFASQFHLLSHAVFKALLFLGAGAVVHTLGARDMRQMGGLGRQMPFTRNAFIVGALALAGIPILNGFWSKELVLEAGLEGGPAWAYAGMLIGAGITALYTFRMVWIVFFGKRHALPRAHDAPRAMRVSLGLLSIGSLVTWLLAGAFGHLLEATLPFHDPHSLASAERVAEIPGALAAGAPATWLALSVVAAGLAAWWWRERLSWLTERLRGLARFASDGLGFEWINQAIIDLTKRAAEALRATQTGQLNWNTAGIVCGLIVVLAVLAWGA